MNKYYLDVTPNGKVGVEELATALKSASFPFTTVEVINNVGGVPPKYIRITVETLPQALNGMVRRMRRIYGVGNIETNRANIVG